MTKLKGILLTEGMHGMISQVEGLAKALDLEFIHEKIELNNFWKLIPPKITPVHDSVFKNKIDKNFDIVISCDGFFFKEKEVAVVGGGNAAVEEAMFLTKFASKVKLIHRRDNLRAEKMLQKKLMENKKIEIIWDTVIEDVIGDKEPKNVKGIKVKNVKTNKIEEIKVDGLFVAIGHDPATSLFKDQLKMDNEGYLITKPDSTETNVPGVYAAGDVKDKTFRQAVTAAGMGCMAALEAEKHLSHK